MDDDVMVSCWQVSVIKDSVTPIVNFSNRQTDTGYDIEFT